MRREVQEEAGMNVAGVNIVGSQPWPIGRAGSNELMVLIRWHVYFGHFWKVSNTLLCFLVIDRVRLHC